VILVDSSALIAMLRAGRDFRHELAPWLRAGTLATCAIIRVEVLRGMRDPRKFKQARDFFALMHEPDYDASFWSGVLDLARDLDRRGYPLHVADLAIAQSAREMDALLVTLDGDFERVPGLRVTRELPRR
jgi:predicted nucleic acid-binding protein